MFRNVSIILSRTKDQISKILLFYNVQRLWRKPICTPLKEYVSDPKPADRTDEIFSKLQQKTTPKLKSTIAAADRYHLLVQDNAAGEFHPLTREAVTPQSIACAKQQARELPEHSWVAIFSGSTHPWFLQSIRSRPRHVSTAKEANARLTTK